jgi:CheY-like chemotaxis protein
VKDRSLLVLVVEPDRPTAALFQLDLTQRGHSVNVVHSAEHALKVLTPEYDVVVTGLRLPEMTGERFIQSVRMKPGYADLPVLVIAADRALPISISENATQLRRKPFNLERFVDYVVEAAGPGRFRN